MNTITVHGKTYKLPKNPLWHEGPPPEIGWWPASIGRNAECLRWWNGEFWSDYVSPKDSKDYAVLSAARKAYAYQRGIEWSRQWWK